MNPFIKYCSAMIENQLQTEIDLKQNNISIAIENNLDTTYFSWIASISTNTVLTTYVYLDNDYINHNIIAPT